MAQKLTKEELLDQCRVLYEKGGISALIYKNIDKKLYHRLYRFGYKLTDILEYLGVTSEYRSYKKEQRRWDWDKLVDAVRPFVEEQNFLPPAGWFQANGYAYIVAALYSLEKNWDDLRKEFDSYENSSFVISRNGLRWRSHPEASLSNFLYARGIQHDLGKKYPPEYSIETGQTYGYYDLEFWALDGRVISVEIWGDKPHGHGEDHYEYKKNLKIEFNKANECFLGIHYSDCYNKEQLDELLSDYIGVIEPYVFEKAHDTIIPSTHWSNADELIEYCKVFASNMPNGVFPTEEWLRKRGKWKEREGEPYNTLSIYIRKWIGGIRNLRKIIGQPENSTIEWSREKVIEAYKEIHEKYGFTPGQLRGKMGSGKMTLPESERKYVNNVDAAVRKYFDSVNDINDLLGIKNFRKKRKK